MSTGDSPKVFISYSHDSDEHADRVLALADKLRAHGIDCVIDQYFPDPPQGWPRWMDDELEKAGFVLVVCTETYQRRATGKEKPGIGRGVNFESILIVQELYDAGMWNEKFVPVLMRPEDAAFIIKPLRPFGRHVIDNDAGFERLRRKLVDDPEVVMPPLGKLEKKGPSRGSFNSPHTQSNENLQPVELDTPNGKNAGNDTHGERSGCAFNFRIWALSGGASLVLVMLLIMRTQMTYLAEQSETRRNMETIGTALKVIASESEDGLWPQLARSDGQWTPELESLYPEVLTDPSLLVAAGHSNSDELLKSLRDALKQPTPNYDLAEHAMGESFGYLGYGVQNESEFEAVRLAKTAENLPPTGEPLENVVTAVPIWPLRDGMERLMLTDMNNPSTSAQATSAIPVLIEIAGWRYKWCVADYKGAYVLFADGRVEFVPYGTFPVVDSVLNSLCGIAAKQDESQSK